MMDPNLIIDDNYVDNVGRNCAFRGYKMEGFLDSYLTILNEIKDAALVEGKTAQALEVFAECVAMLNDQLTTLSKSVQRTGSAFIQEINTADEYLF